HGCGPGQQLRPRRRRPGRCSRPEQQAVAPERSWPASRRPTFRSAEIPEATVFHHNQTERTKPTMRIRDRIKKLRRVPAKELLPNPKNWRSHPPAQQDALRGLLAELGYCDATIARLLPDGRLQLIDGHLRCETTPDMEVPVLVLDVTEGEA